MRRDTCGFTSIPDEVDAVSRYLPKLPDALGQRLENRAGDAAKLPYPDANFDVLTSIEAISHYLDPDAFLGEAARVLRPGGVLVVADGNNGANRSIVRETHLIWQAFEEGSCGDRAGSCAHSCVSDRRLAHLARGGGQDRRVRTLR